MHVRGCVFFEGGGTKVRGANYEGWVVVTSATQLIVEAEAHGTLQRSHVLTVDFVVFQPRRGVECLVVVSYPLIDGLRGKTALLRRGKIAVDIECRRLAAGRFLPDILSNHVQDSTDTCLN